MQEGKDMGSKNRCPNCGAKLTVRKEKVLIRGERVNLADLECKACGWYATADALWLERKEEDDGRA